MTPEQIKKMRQALNLSQEAFARLIGVGLRTVSSWEAGDSKPRGLSLRRLEETQKMIDKKIAAERAREARAQADREMS